jgi:hypothetical protein
MPNAGSLLVQDAALFDMQFQVGVKGSAAQLCLVQTNWVAADSAHALKKRTPLGNTVQFTGAQFPRGRAAPVKSVTVEAGFFTAPHDSLKRTAGYDAILVQYPQNLDCGKRAEITVKVAAIRNRIDMGPE